MTALLGAGAVLTEALIRAPGVPAPAYLLVLVVAAPLAFRTAAPLRTLLVAGCGAVLCAAVLDASWAVTAVVCVALFTVALYGDRRRSLAVGVVTAVAVTAAVLGVDGTIDAAALFARIALVFLCVAGGEVIRSRQELGVARREQAERDARQREEQLHRRATAERMQIARELHDTLAHSLVAINVRASVAIDVPDSQDAGAALRDIKSVSASALRDLRSTLSALRDQDDHAPTAPAAGLDALAALVDRARAAGVDAQLDVRVEDPSIPAAITAATVRIVQESLTNVVRHAHADHAKVAVLGRRGTLHIEITDDGTARPATSTEGFGVRGMTERAAALGGDLEAGPNPDGGWSVRARLPLGGTA